MEKLNDATKESTPLVEAAEPVVQPEAPEATTASEGEAMWLLDQSQVDVMPDSYEVTDTDGTTYTAINNVKGIDTHTKYRDTKEAKDASLKRSYGDSERCKTVRKFTPGEPITLPAGQKPNSLSELGEEGKGKNYKRIEGTLESPNTEYEYCPDTLFINGTTYAEDVIQYDIGDCYFLAALLSIVHADPSYIPKIMSVNNGLVRTNFYHKEGKGKDAHWVRKPIETKYGVMNFEHTVKVENSKKEIEKRRKTQKGSYHRIAFDPKESIWRADVQANELSITRKDMYEAAMWVNCIEQAFTYYARLYGQYGDDSQAEEDVAKRDGLTVIDGGFAGKCLHMFFGDEVPDSTVYGTTTHSREKEIWESSTQLIAELMKLAMTQDGSKKEDTFICVAAHKADIGKQGVAYVEALTAEIEAEIDSIEDEEKKTALANALEVLKDVAFLVGKYLGEPVIGAREGIKSDSESQICDSLHEAQMKLADNETLMAMNNGNYLALRSVLGTIIEDKYNDIFILQRHAYNVARVDFKDKDGNPIEIKTSTTLDELKDLADLDKSIVVLENPHGETKAVRPGESRTRVNEGAFETSLRETLASITQFTSVVGQNHRHDDDENAESIANSGAMQATTSGAVNYLAKYNGAKYEYWNYDNTMKGEILRESDVAERGPLAFEHIENPTEEQLSSGDMFLKLNEEGKQTGFDKPQPSETMREVPEGKKYEVTKGIRSAGLPSPKELYTESENGIEVKYFLGTIKDPNISSGIVPNGLFIDDMPSTNDVIQGGIGDCYFLASVLHVLNKEPQRIKDMISIQGDEVDVAFYHLAEKDWKPVHVRTKWGYTGAKVPSVDNNKIYAAGAKVRIADKPKGAPLWQASINGQTLSINKKAMHEAAMWVNLMENAYDLFAEKYGKYGRGTAENSDSADNGSGFGRMGSIHFGKSQCLQLFFGQKADNHTSANVNIGKNGDLMNGNEAVYKALLDFCNPQEQKVSDTLYRCEDSMICASISSVTLVSRLKMLAKSILKEAKKSEDPKVTEAKSILEEMVKYIDKTKALNGAGDSGVTNEEAIAALTTLNEYSVKLVEYNEELMALPSWMKFRNATASLVNMTQNRFIFANHAYNVKKVELVDKEGNLIKTTDVKDLMSRIDLQKSQVTMQNPHGTGTPTYDPTTGDQQGSNGIYNGEFTISIEDYLWNIETMAVSTCSYYTSKNS